MLAQPLYGPPVPMGIWGRVKIRATQTPGKADPTWDTALTPKFPKPITPNLLQPMGAAKTLDAMGRFESRVAEIEAIAATQHLELPTLNEELAANGVSVVLPSGDDDDGLDWSEGELGARHRPLPIACEEDEIVPAYKDIPTMSALTRRIEWEKYTFACGPVRTARLTTKSGQLAIQEVGRPVSQAPDKTFLQQALRSFVAAYGTLPDADTLDEMRAFSRYYDNKPVLAELDEQTHDQLLIRGRKVTTIGPGLIAAFGEDHDPLRAGFADTQEDADDFDGVPALGVTGVEDQPCWDCGEVLGHAGFSDGPNEAGKWAPARPLAPGADHADPTLCLSHLRALEFGFLDSE